MTIKQIQEVIKRAHTMHEESWQDCDDYTLAWYDCFLTACEEVGVPKEMAPLLGLANVDGYNDLATWAECGHC